MRKLLYCLFIFLIFSSIAFAEEEIIQEVPFEIQENYDVTYKSILTFLDIYNCKISTQNYETGYIEAKIPDANFSRCEYTLNISSGTESTQITATNITLNQKSLKKKKKDRIVDKNNKFLKEEIEKCTQITKKKFVILVTSTTDSSIELNVNFSIGLQSSSSYITRKPIFMTVLNDLNIEEMSEKCKKEYNSLKNKTQKDLYKSQLYLGISSVFGSGITLVAQSQKSYSSVIVGYIFLNGEQVSFSSTNTPYGIINLHCDIANEVVKQILKELK